MGGVPELEIARLVGLRVVAHVGGEDDELDLGGGERGAELGGPSDSPRDRRWERVVVRPAGESPDRAWPERILRLNAHEELLEVVEAVERRHRSRQGSGRRSVDPTDPRPERVLAQALEEAELQEHPIDAAARENDCDVALGGDGHEAIVPPWSRSFVLVAQCSRTSASRRTRISGRTTAAQTTAAGS